MSKLIHTDLGWQIKAANGTIYGAVYATRDLARIAAKLPAEPGNPYRKDEDGPAEDIDDGADLGIGPVKEDIAHTEQPGTSFRQEDGTFTKTPEPIITLDEAIANTAIEQDALYSQRGGNGYQHRETWLHAVADRLAVELFETPFGQGFLVPKNIRYSCGFPSQRAMLPVSGESAKVRVGECWGSDKSGDDTFEIFISPLLSDPLKVAGTLTHEMCHAVAGLNAKHGAAFKRVALHVLLEGKMTACTGGDDFAAKVSGILADAGPYPMATLDARKMTNGKKKQSTRMIKVECPMCQYTARVASKWLKEKGAPHCPEHGVMEYDLAEPFLDGDSQDKD